VGNDAVEYSSEDAPAPHEIPDGDPSSGEATEYSVSGWFKFILGAEETRKPCHLIFRLANNNPESLADSDHLGDRTLAAF
jgi:hypothetical protein